MADELQAIPQLPFRFAKAHGVLIRGVHDHQLDVVYRGQPHSTVFEEVKRFSGAALQVESVDDDLFNQLLSKAYETDSDTAMYLAEDFGDEFNLAELVNQMPITEDLLEMQDDAPVIRLLNALLTEAIKKMASDIHIETFEDRLVVRFRVDGVLQKVLEPARILAPIIISRIKVMAKLDIAEKRLPQDGRIALKLAGRSVDVRVSTMPTGHGERVVLRLLDKQAARLDLTHLGIPDKMLADIMGIIHQPHGIILVTGPTGSGKTSSLYAALTVLNKTSRNILTVEDPIEYYLEGVGQTQVNAKVDMTFAKGLRAMLRQDPDVVMVGEIRDLETAEIAVQASLTGHLVLSTLHTNSAVGAITRLHDMGVESFLLASSLIGVLAQRLVRLLCEHCREKRIATESECEFLYLDPKHPPEIYHAKGCEHCGASGYLKRMGVYDLIIIDDTLSKMIHDGVGEHELQHYCETRYSSLRKHGIQLILGGKTSIEEILRITSGR